MKHTQSPKLRVNEVVLVEGRYDATALAGVMDGLILTTGGFSIFNDDEKKALIRKLGAQRGLLILTDSDAAGFRIRHYIEKIARGCVIKHAYIPALPGKEKRKAAPGKEGVLGVEGMTPERLRAALEQAGVTAEAAPDGPDGQAITPADLYQWGLSGTAGSAERLRALLASIGLPPRLSKNALCKVLSNLYTRPQFEALALQKPALFWDFHGTLTHSDVNWFDAAMEAAAETVPHRSLALETLTQHFGGTCLPWFTVESRDTRHLAGSDAWWRYCEGEFAAMFQRCGFTADEAAALAPRLRGKILQPHRYRLYADARPTLEALRARGYRHYILSNNFPELEEVVTALGMRHLFEEVLVSGMVGYEKPRPEIFAAARAAAGGGRQPVMIGDNPRDDIAGGKAAGFATVAVHGVPAGDADHAVDELAELLEIFR